MAINFKSDRVRAARDLLHLKGRHEPTFKKKVDLILEILGLCYSPRSLSWCRRYAAELRDQNPSMSPEQLTLFGVLEDRLFKKKEMIENRQSKKATKRGRPPKTAPVTPGTPAPSSDLMDVWQSILEEKKP
jgi:hypothetical protein